MSEMHKCPACGLRRSARFILSEEGRDIAMAEQLERWGYCGGLQDGGTQGLPIDVELDFTVSFDAPDA